MMWYGDDVERSAEYAASIPSEVTLKNFCLYPILSHNSGLRLSPHQFMSPLQHAAIIICENDFHVVGKFRRAEHSASNTA